MMVELLGWVPAGKEQGSLGCRWGGHPREHAGNPVWAPGKLISEVRSSDREFLAGQSLGQTVSPCLPGKPVLTQHCPTRALRSFVLQSTPGLVSFHPFGDLKVDFERKRSWVEVIQPPTGLAGDRLPSYTASPRGLPRKVLEEKTYGEDDSKWEQLSIASPPHPDLGLAREC